VRSTAVKIVVFLLHGRLLSASSKLLSLLIWPAELHATATTLTLSGVGRIVLAPELFEFFEVNVCDRFACITKCLLKVLTADFRHRIKFLKILLLVWVDLHSGLHLHFGFDGISDSRLGCSLADFCQVGTGKAVGELGDKVEIDVLGDWCFAQVCVEYVPSGRFVG
jgi:hypothetical protein